VVVIISANVEWSVVRQLYPQPESQSSPYGEWFIADLDVSGQAMPVLFFHGGWGKISAAASCQYVIDRWRPELLVNLGTCGGFTGTITQGTIIWVDRTIVYDIVEQMFDAEEAIGFYQTEIDLSWLGANYPHSVHRGVLLSADRDIIAGDVPMLRRRFDGVAADWESGAIAWVCSLHGTKCLILHGVTDLVGEEGGEAYQGNAQVFMGNTQVVTRFLIGHLSAWLKEAQVVAGAISDPAKPHFT
jgi:adenosylhomocysteine nucleosidase